MSSPAPTNRGGVVTFVFRLFPDRNGRALLNKVIIIEECNFTLMIEMVGFIEAKTKYVVARKVPPDEAISSLMKLSR